MVRSQALYYQLNYTEAIQVLQKGLQDASDKFTDMKDLLDDINEAQRLDQLLPGDHPERHNFENFNQDMINKGAIVSKCKPRWENPFYRYIHAK